MANTARRPRCLEFQNQWQAAWDQGMGSYESSDFHHNGDLQNYADPWEINVEGLKALLRVHRPHLSGHSKLPSLRWPRSMALWMTCDWRVNESRTP